MTKGSFHISPSACLLCSSPTVRSLGPIIICEFLYLIHLPGVTKLSLLLGPTPCDVLLTILRLSHLLLGHCPGPGSPLHRTRTWAPRFHLVWALTLYVISPLPALCSYPYFFGLCHPALRCSPTA